MFYPPTYPQEKEKLLKEMFHYLANNKIFNRINLEKNIRQFLQEKKVKDFFPKFWHLYFVFLRYFSNSNVQKKFIDLIKVVRIRSLSGIIPLSVFTQPLNSCPYNCVYCPTADNAPKSYFPDEAAVMRAIRNHYDPFLQTRERLIQFYLSGHNIDKIDLIIQGGTFSFYEKKYRQWFLKRCYDAANSDISQLIKTGKEERATSKNLNHSKIINEKAKSRVIGVTIETRPDFINKKEILFLRKLGVTRVELGVQHLDQKILNLVRRGNTVSDVYQATKLLRDCGFKITYHLMPGLPGSTFEKDYLMLKKIFLDERFKPDQIKFYPTQVVKNSLLGKWYLQGKYKPIDEEYLLNLTLKFKKKIVPPWLRINRLVRDLTKNDLVYENFPSNFRQNLERELKKHKISCLCIRCREIRDKKIIGHPSLNIIRYDANEGKEFFIEMVDKKYQLLGFLRLRIPSFIFSGEKFFIKSLNDSAIIRELHVYGQVVPLSEKGYVQHRGIGLKLIDQAIKISKQFGLKKIAVIAGVGVREYYRKRGFFDDNDQGEYLIKFIND